MPGFPQDAQESQGRPEGQNIRLIIIIIFYLEIHVNRPGSTSLNKNF